MSSVCRSALMAGVRSVTARSKTLVAPKPMSSSPFSSPSSARSIPCPASSNIRVFRIASVLGSVESMMPLHSAIASARLKSSIAVDSTCWSWLSLGFATPL